MLLTRTWSLAILWDLEALVTAHGCCSRLQLSTEALQHALLVNVLAPWSLRIANSSFALLSSSSRTPADHLHTLARYRTLEGDISHPCD